MRPTTYRFSTLNEAHAFALGIRVASETAWAAHAANLEALNPINENGQWAIRVQPIGTLRVTSTVHMVENKEVTPMVAPMADASGTHLQGYVTATFEELVAAFGKPIEGDGEKVDAEWILAEGNTIATIYNYKDGKNYLGEEGTPTAMIVDWHIGGHSKAAIELVKRGLGR